MVKILALCHGKNLDNPPGTKCLTSLVNINSATFLDRDKLIKPHILQDLKKPFVTKIKYDIITTVCCDGDVFYDDKTKSIVDQTFNNIKNALKNGGVFILPKYNWLNNKVLKEIQIHLKHIRKINSESETFYIFRK